MRGQRLLAGHSAEPPDMSARDLCDMAYASMVAALGEVGVSLQAVMAKLDEQLDTLWLPRGADGRLASMREAWGAGPQAEAGQRRMIELFGPPADPAAAKE